MQTCLGLDRNRNSTLNYYNKTYAWPKIILFSLMESLWKVLQLIYFHPGMIHNLTEPNNINMQTYSEYEQSNIGHLLFL